MTDPSKSLPEDVFFPADLGGIIQVHPLTTTALAEPWTGRVSAFQRDLDDLITLGEMDAPTPTDILQGNEVTRCCERDKYYAIIEMAQAAAARNKLFDTNGG